MRWQDVLDILLNSYILFRLYVLFRGTNVIRLLLVIFGLWLASRTAVSLGLIITNWAMQGLVTVAALIIIIVFRNEIASVLQTKNLKSFLWGIPQYQFRTPLSIIVESVYELASHKIGALIVLPLKQGFASVVQGGVPIHGELSQELLVSIFWPDNPLHDGACIIEGARITRAGTILPLSKREDLPSFFGTRHRAGMGLTEFIDALVLVVSEERGKISLFKDNRTHAVRSRQDLEILLQTHAGDDSANKGLKRQTRELLIAGLICLLSVTGIWLNFSRGMETLATHEVPVEFINPEQKMEIISSSASRIKLLMSGTRPLINAIKTEQIYIKLNLTGAAVGENTLPIKQKDILLPPGIRLKSIEPDQIQVTLDALGEKELPVQPHWVGKLPGDLVMISAKALPPTVLLMGGRLALKEVATVYTEPIPLDKIADSGTITATLVLNSTAIKFKHNQKIQIQYQVSKKSVNQ